MKYIETLTSEYGYLGISTIIPPLTYNDHKLLQPGESTPLSRNDNWNYDMYAGMRATLIKSYRPPVVANNPIGNT